MGHLSSALSKEEIGLLIEAVSDWEAIGNHEFHVLSMVKKQPMPDEDDDQYEFIKQIKDHFKKREKEIQDSCTLRQEKAILAKAKLVLIRHDLGIGQLFENSQIPSASIQVLDDIASGQVATPQEKTQLELAEFYIKDLGVWDMYQKFLQERAEKPSNEITG